ncbi:hypothetical protein FACS1894172_20270 [Spirochaetia bacterium]|nr:hypothetical protein FACS1894172_20270 [Spirochaetia bacterium]
MLIDSDVMIWFYRGKSAAKQIISCNIPFRLSAISYMELYINISPFLIEEMKI